MPTRQPSPEEPASELRRIPIRDNGEPLVEIPDDRVYWTPRHPVFEYRRYRLARRSVAEMLREAAAGVPQGILLAVVEGWRPPEIQRQMYASTRERLRAEHPDWTERHLTRVTNRFSAPMDPKVPPPHTTGGAVDVHLCTPDGEPLDFTSPFDLMDPRQAPMDAEPLSEIARRNRELLRDVMTSAGFTNYPMEWWHWSYGDPGWAYRGGHPHALYGAIEPAEMKDADFSFRPRENPGW